VLRKNEAASKLDKKGTILAKMYHLLILAKESIL